MFKNFTVFLILVVATSSIWAAQELKYGLYQAQSKWGDDRSASLAWNDKTANSSFEAPPQVLNIWWLQYQIDLSESWGASLKGGYHFNHLNPYQIVPGVRVGPGSSNSFVLDEHQGLEDFELIGFYKKDGLKFHFGAVVPLFQAKPKTLKGEASAWDGFRAIRSVVGIEGFNFNQWWFFKADIVTAPLADSRVETGDGVLQMMNFWGYPINATLGLFAGQIAQLNFYHWAPEFTANKGIFRREFLWEPQVGVSIKTRYGELKSYIGATAWSTAEVREDGENQFSPAQASRNLILGFDLSHKW